MVGLVGRRRRRSGSGEGVQRRSVVHASHGLLLLLKLRHVRVPSLRIMKERVVCVSLVVL
jgi:hypothetical protein